MAGPVFGRVAGSERRVVVYSRIALRSPLGHHKTIPREEGFPNDSQLQPYVAR